MTVTSPNAATRTLNPSDTLVLIRHTSCYAGLRTWINLGVGLLIPLALLAGFALGFNHAENRGEAVIVTAISWLSSVIILVALRGLVMALLDIADTLIATHARGPR
jgi:hypothetical protein